MGIYLIQTPASFLMNLLGQTLLPTFSKVQGNKVRENRILLQVTSILVQVGMPALIFMFFCGHSLLFFRFYGPRYSVAALPLAVASSVVFLNILNGQITTVFYGRGVPQLHRSAVAIMAGLMVVTVYPFAKLFGLVGGQLACLLAVAAGYAFQLIRVHRLTDLSLSRYAKPFLSSVVISLVVLGLCLAARSVPALTRPLPNILFGAFVCITGLCLMWCRFPEKK